MIVSTIAIPYAYGETFKLLPISDIHFDGKGRKSVCDIAKLRKHLREQVDEKTIILGIGDWFGGILPSDVKRYRKDNDGAEGPDILDESIEGLAEELRPYKEHIYGIGDGNHEDSILTHCGTNLIKRLIKELGGGILHLGYSGLLQLKFGIPSEERETTEKVRSLVIRYHHGWGGGSRTEGADITKFAHDVKYWQAQLFLYGHVHKLKLNDIEEGLMVGESNWKTIIKRMVVCGTYQKTYSNTTSATYAEKRGYNPATLRHPIIYLRPERTSGVDVRIET
jgi:hypothetical protein